MPILIVRRVKVSLELFRLSVSALISFASAVFASLTGNATFTTPPVPLSVLQTAYNDLQFSLDAAMTGGPEATADMKAKREILINLLTNLGHYVEDIANEPANAADANAIILSAGMKTKDFSPRQKQVYAVFAGTLVGTVLITAARAVRGTHEWQYTLTPLVIGSWVVVPSTTRARTVVTGLTSGTLVYVRHRAVLKTGLSNWDPDLSVVVP